MAPWCMRQQHDTWTAMQNCNRILVYIRSLRSEMANRTLVLHKSTDVLVPYEAWRGDPAGHGGVEQARLYAR